MNLFKSQAAIAVIDQSLVSGLNFVLAIYLAKVMGLTVFGTFSVILIIAYLGQEILKALVISPMMTYAAKPTNLTYISQTFTMAVIVSLILAGIGSIYVSISDILPSDTVVYAYVLFLFFASRYILDFLRRYFFALGKGIKTLIIDGLSAFLIITGLVLISGNKNLSHVIGIYALANGVACCVFIYDLLKNALSVKRETIVLHWSFGKWLLGNAFVTYTASNLLLLMAGHVLGNSSIGIIRTAQYTLGGMIILFQAMDNIMPGKLAGLLDDKRAFKTEITRFISIMTVICFIHVAAVLLLIDPICAWFHIENEYLFKELVIMNGFLSFILILNYAMHYALRAFSVTKPIFFANAFTAVLNIVFGYFILKAFDIYGIMIGLISFQIVAGMVLFKAYRKHV